LIFSISRISTMQLPFSQSRCKRRAIPTEIANELIGASLPRTTTRRLDPKLREAMQRLHALGPRPTSELLLEMAERIGAPAWFSQRLAAYASMDPGLVSALHAGDWREERRAR
jgi:hypothetical protein